MVNPFSSTLQTRRKNAGKVLGIVRFLVVTELITFDGKLKGGDNVKAKQRNTLSERSFDSD
jgi:hypothetical protein